MKRIFLFYILIFFFSKTAFADPLYLSLDEALKIGLESNHDYKIAALKEKESKERVSKVWSELMPVVESEASITRQYGESGFLSLSDGEDSIKFVQLKFGINPGVFYNSLQAAEKSYIISKEDVRRIRSEISFVVIQSYFDLLLTEELIKLHRESAVLLGINLKDVENMYKLGSVPKFELLQAQVQLLNHEPEIFSAESKNRVAIEHFNYVLGSEENKYAARGDILEMDVKKVPLKNMDKKIDQLISLAIKSRPEVEQLRKKIEVATHLKEAYSSYYIWPSFFLGGYYGISKPYPNEIDSSITTPFGTMTPDLSSVTGKEEWQRNWQVRFSASYRWGSLFSTDTVRSLEREESIKINQAKEELEKFKRAISVNINSSYSKLIAAYLTIQSQKENVKTAQEGLRIARESYKEGVIKNSDLLAAELSLTKARTLYINALYSYYVALAELKRDSGVEDENIILGEVYED
ncbi:MAG TPA: TolC family protein [Spirochaetota bacterium]|nr:TolC family protein [Spirochaetota bacterium]